MVLSTLSITYLNCFPKFHACRNYEKSNFLDLEKQTVRGRKKGKNKTKTKHLLVSDITTFYHPVNESLSLQTSYSIILTNFSCQNTYFHDALMMCRDTKFHSGRDLKFLSFWVYVCLPFFMYMTLRRSLEEKEYTDLKSILHCYLSLYFSVY